MKLDSARDLKATLNETVVKPLGTSFAMKATLGLAAQPMTAAGSVSPTMALGLIRKGTDDYALAVRVQKHGLESSPQVDTITKQAKGEVDVRYIGQVIKRPETKVPAQRKLTRPLKIGLSVGHFKITAGTLGAFVRDLGDGAVMILSNNHVLANENKAKKGDIILQPGEIDDGRNPEDRIATLTRFVGCDRASAKDFGGI